MRYHLTEAARQDVRDITEYIRHVQESPQNARLVATRLKAAFEKLVEFPQLGHVHEELRDDQARAYAVTGLLVIYDPSLKPLTVLRVIHAARDLRRVKPR
jgi:antitoxin ParD1/3/4/toxin ParE1/3/4